jgi:hypothetical protein
LMPFLGQQLVAICPVKWRRSFDEFASWTSSCLLMLLSKNSLLDRCSAAKDGFLIQASFRYLLFVPGHHESRR